MSQPHTLIVGGSSGIGLATAHHLLGLGHAVTIAGRRADRLAAAQASLPDTVRTLTLDARDRADLPVAFSGLAPIDHLVLALGSGKGVGPFSAIDVDDVRQGFDEKFVPHFAVAQAALPRLAAEGSITFVSAVTAVAAMPGTAGIAAANAAVAALVPVLASELRPRRVNGVAPGIIDTPWWDFLAADQRSQVFADYAARTPVGRIGRPEDVAGAIGALISNTFLTGQVLVCDGGLRLG